MSMGLFVTGIWAGMVLVYVITKYFSITNEPTLDELIRNEMDKPDIIEKPITNCAMTLEEMDEWYNAMMNIFAIKED